MRDGRKRFLIVAAANGDRLESLARVYGQGFAAADLADAAEIGRMRYRLWCRSARAAPADGDAGDPDRRVVIGIGHDIVIGDGGASGIEPRITVTIDRKAGEIRVHAPLSCAYPLFYRRLADGLLIAAFPQDLVTRRPDLDEQGLCGFLHYGAAVAPHTVLEGVERFVPGPEWRIDMTDLGVSKRLVGHVSERGETWRPKSTAELDERVSDLIDRTLEESCPDRAPLILFSGGIDSGLLAARAAALGWSDATLVHYSFGGEDPETDYARRMASELGLRLELVEPEPDFVPRFLSSIGRAFPQPSSDHSVIPSSELVQSLGSRFPDRHSVLDGTSADAFFGSYSLDRFWRFLFAIPLPLRRLASLIYRRGGYAGRDEPIEKYLRTLRLTTLAPKAGLTSVLTNALSNVAYHFDPETVAAMHEDIDDWVANIAPVETVYGFMMLGFCQHAIELCAQKTSHWLVDSGQHMVFPYHWTRSTDFFHHLDLSSMYWASDKATLKRLLRRSVSQELVDRPKGIFVAPMTDLFRESAVGEVFHDLVLSPSNPLSPYLDRPQLERFAKQMRDGTPFPRQSRHLIWAMIFISLWLDQFDAYAAGEANQPGEAAAAE